MANKHLEEVIEAALAVRAAEARLETALVKWRANTEVDEAVEFIHREVSIPPVLQKEEPADKKHRRPLGEASKQFVVELIKGYKDAVDPRFNAFDVQDFRPAPHNNVKGAASMLKTLAARGLVKRDGEGYWVIPSMKNLRGALKW